MEIRFIGNVQRVIEKRAERGDFHPIGAQPPGKQRREAVDVVAPKNIHHRRQHLLVQKILLPGDIVRQERAARRFNQNIGAVGLQLARHLVANIHRHREQARNQGGRQKNRQKRQRLARQIMSPKLKNHPPKHRLTPSQNLRVYRQNADNFPRCGKSTFSCRSCSGAARWCSSPCCHRPGQPPPAQPPP